MTSSINEHITDFFLIKLEFINNIGDHGLSLRQCIIAFPVGSYKNFSHL